MTGTNYLYKDYIKLAYTIKHDIKEKFGYTVNIGIANNKLCAKMASDFEKPDMVHTLFKNEIETKLWPLPVGELFMVGKATKEELSKLNIKTIKELALSDEKLLYQRFKNQAIYLKKASWGLDDSKVEQRSEKKTSISVSETLPHDIIDSEVLKEYIFMFVEKTTRELRKQKQYAKTVAVFYKNNKFENYSAQAKLDNPCNNTKEIYKLALQIFSKSYKNDPIRLIGIRLADLTENNERQLSIFDTEQQEEISTIQETLDTINQKFGKSIVAPASIKLINAKTNFKRQP
jgi:DNA polymerase-4